MKAILFFVTAGIVLDRHREAAATIAKETGKKVVFRNGSANVSERPEENEGVAGKVPANYAAFTRYDDDGTIAEGGGISTIPAPSERKLNAIGLPDGEGCPEDREALKEALEEEGVPFHGNASTEKLVDLYVAHFYGEG